MKKLVFAAVAAVSLAGPAYAMTYFLESQWVEGGNRFCRYSNGTVLNVGIKLCALSIKG